MTQLGDSDIKTTQCVAYGQTLPPATNIADDAAYEVIG